MTKPLYRLKIVVYDEETDERVSVTDQPLYFDPGAAQEQLQRALSEFDSKRLNFEQIHYPDPVN